MTVSIPSEACRQRSVPSPDRLAMHVLLWSQSQCALHIEPLMDMLTKNRRACAADHCMDYVPLTIGTREECDAAASRLRPVLNERRSGTPSH